MSGQLLDVFGLKALRTQTAMVHLVQLIGDYIQDVLAVGLSGVAAVAVMPAEVLEVVVQVTHRLPLGNPEQETS